MHILDLRSPPFRASFPATTNPYDLFDALDLHVFRESDAKLKQIPTFSIVRKSFNFDFPSYLVITILMTTCDGRVSNRVPSRVSKGGPTHHAISYHIL